MSENEKCEFRYKTSSGAFTGEMDIEWTSENVLFGKITTPEYTDVEGIIYLREDSFRVEKCGEVGRDIEILKMV